MNEELLQLIYSKFNTEASYEDFKTDFGSDENLRKASYSKLNTKASYDQFIQDVGYTAESTEPKKATADSTVSPSDSALPISDSDSQNLETNTSLDSLPSQEIEPDVNLEVAQLYDQYKESGQITEPQMKEIKSKLDAQQKGERTLWEDADAFTTGMLKTGYFIPLYKYDKEEDLVAKRIQRNKTNFLEALPEEKVTELNAYAVNRTVELNAKDKNILAQNEILSEKARLLSANLKNMQSSIKQIQDEGNLVPEEGKKMYLDAYKELQNIGQIYNENVDIIEDDQEDIGDFTEELDLLKRNYGGLDYYTDVARLATADMIGGLMEFGVSTAEMSPRLMGAPSSGEPLEFPNADNFVKEFRGEVSRQRELLRPQMSVNDIDDSEDFGQWLAEQTATQLPTVTVLMASGGTAGLATIGASSGGQKMGQLRDELSDIEQREKELQGALDSGDFIDPERKQAIIDELRELEAKPEYSQGEIYLAGIAVGTSEALTERVTLGILSKGKRALTAAKNSGATGQIKKGVGTYVKQTLGSGFSEGGSEFINQLAQNSVDILYLGKEDVHFFDGTEDALASGFALGSGMRGVPTIIGLGAKTFMPRTQSNKVSTNAKKIEDMINELEANDNLSEESKSFIQGKIDSLTKETQQEFVDAFGKLPQIGEAGIKELINLDKKASGILKLVKEVDNSTLSEEVKAELKETYKKQIDEISNKKESILNPDLDGSKQTTQEAVIQEEGDLQAPKQTAVEEGADQGTKGGDKIQGKDGNKSSLDINDNGVQSNIVGDKGGKPEPNNKPVEDIYSHPITGKKAKSQSELDTMVVKTKERISELEVTKENKINWDKGKANMLKNQKAILKSMENFSFKEAENDLMNNLSNPKKKSINDRGDIEAKIDEDIANGMTEAEAIANLPTKKQRMIGEDVLSRRKTVDGATALSNMRESYNKSQKEMKAKKATQNFLTKGLRKIAKNFWDRQYIPKMLLMKAGGKTVRNYIITTKGASGFAKYKFDKAYDKIYKGLSDSNIDILNQVILQKRFIAIDKNREQKGMDAIVHPDFQNRQTSEAALRELKKELGDKKYNDMAKRSEAYFKEFKDILDSMYESGIVSKDFRDSFMDVDYQPRVFLQFLTDQEQQMSIIEMGAPESTSLGAKQIQELEAGSNESLITDSMYLLGRSMNTRAKSVAMNTTTRKLVEFMDEQSKVVEGLKKKKNPSREDKRTIKYFEELSNRVQDNPIVGFSESGNPQFKSKPRFGFKTQAYYVDGVKRQLLMEETFFDQYNDNLKAIFNNSNVREKVAIGSLSGLVKTIATGNNPAFFITNSPRDFMFIATFSEEYGANVATNLFKIAKDTYTGIKDMRKDRTNFQEFVKHGGMLDYLHTQGKFKGTTAMQKIINNVVDNRVKEKGKKVFDWATLNKLQMYSEIGFRMGVFNRSIKNQMKEMGLANIEDATKEQKEDIYTNAAASARNTTDFSQGGIYTKDVDAIIPYLNAGVQGTRVAIESLNERPVETMLRMAQSSAILASMPVGISLWMLGNFRDEENEPKDDKELSTTELYLKAMDGVSQYDKTNYQILFTGKRTEEGEFEFVRISKPHFLTPMISYAQSIQHNIMREGLGMEKESPIENVKFALEKNISPVEMSITGNLAKNPLLKSALTYTTGYDFYRDQDLSYLRGKVPVPVEGHESKAVEDFYKKIGENTLVSPARMKGAVESIITTPSTSPFVGMLYGGLDIATADKDAMDTGENIKKNLLKSVVGRVRKETSEFNRRKDWDKMFLKEFSLKEIETLKNKSLFKDMAKRVRDKDITNEEINEEFKRIAEGDVFELNRLSRTFKETLAKPDTDPTVIDLKFRKPSQRALILAEIFGDSLLEDSKELSKTNKKLKDELFSNKILNRETIIKYLEVIENKEGSN